ATRSSSYITFAADVTACQAAAAGLPVSGYLAMLAAFLTASATLCPFATAAALRLTVR
ncbi:heme exporter protein CcmB, partial [Klebsiella pneumoniae]